MSCTYKSETIFFHFYLPLFFPFWFRSCHVYCSPVPVKALHSFYYISFTGHFQHAGFHFIFDSLLFTSSLTSLQQYNSSRPSSLSNTSWTMALFYYNNRFNTFHGLTNGIASVGFDFTFVVAIVFMLYYF